MYMDLASKTVSEFYNIAVLITCHNRKVKTLQCLKSLFNNEIPHNYKIEVFLVDDGSTDGSGTEIKKIFPQVNIIVGDGNLFWNRGMNLAWKTAVDIRDFNFFLWLNDDIELHQNSLNILLNDYLSVGSDDSIIVGACSSITGDVTYSGYIGLTKKLIIKPNGTIQKCEYFNGNIVLIPHSVFNKIGYLDSNFHHGQGDFDYGLRAKKKEINSWVSSKYIGICERHIEFPKWCNPDLSFKKRWESFRSPLGGRPSSTFFFQRKYIGLCTAIFHYLTLHLRLVIPKIWNKNSIKNV